MIDTNDIIELLERQSSEKDHKLFGILKEVIEEPPKIKKPSKTQVDIDLVEKKITETTKDTDDKTISTTEKPIKLCRQMRMCRHNDKGVCTSDIVNKSNKECTDSNGFMYFEER